MFSWASFWPLILLLAIPWIAWRLLRRPRGSGLQFSRVGGLGGLEPSWRQQTSWVPPVLRLAAVALLIVSLAGPQQGRTQRTIQTEGIAIQLVLDCSGSMETQDFRVDQRAVDRLQAVKDVAGRFVAGDDRLPGRPADLVGLIKFAKNAESICPLTLDHGYLLAGLEQIEPVDAAREDGTAIGDALGLAVERLHALEQRRLRTGQSEIEGKIVILLTDGEHNAGHLRPLEAAELAAALDVRVYTIGVGSERSRPTALRENRQGAEEWREIDWEDETLRRIASITGGRFFRASSTESLSAIYGQIERLEKSRFDDQRYVDFRELAIEPFQVGPFGFPPLALAALLCLSVAVMLESTVHRRVP